jgi:hypothetical protein
MSDDAVKTFCEKHNIVLVDKNKRAHRYHKVNLNYFRDPMNFNMVQEELVALSEPLYTVEIAESELQWIAEFEAQVFNNMNEHGSQHYMLFNVMMEQKEKEKRLKVKYPAVKKAYEHYSLILKLAESGEL